MQVLFSSPIFSPLFQIVIAINNVINDLVVKCMICFIFIYHSITFSNVKDKISNDIFI